MPAPCCATSGCWATARRGRSPARPLMVAGERADRRRPRRGASDRGLAAAARRHRDRARHRSRGTTAALHRQRADRAGHPGPRAMNASGFASSMAANAHVIAIKMEGTTKSGSWRSTASPAEPFPARNGALVLAPGGRADAFVDASAAPGSSSSILLHDGKQARADRPAGDLGRAAVPRSAAAAGAAAAIQRPAGPARPQERPARRGAARWTPRRLGHARRISHVRGAGVPRQGRPQPWCWP